MPVGTKIYIPLQNGDFKTTLNKVHDAIKKLTGSDPETRCYKKAKEYDPNNPLIRDDMYEMWEMNFTIDESDTLFECEKEERRMWTYWDNYSPDRLVYFSIGCWGRNEDIARYLVDKFGGYANFNDCDSIEIDYCAKQPQN